MKNLTKLTALTLTAALALTACGSSAAATASTPRQAGMTIIRMLDRNSRFLMVIGVCLLDPCDCTPNL